jgi:serine/threonine-protein kinase
MTRSFPPGARLGPYEIVSLLGAGGMGEVYRARDERLKRDVAIKVVVGSRAHDPALARRLEQEGQTLGALSHANILAVYDIGVHDDALYVVSELLEGQSLRERLRDGALPLSRAVDLGAQIARGLAAAHAKGIVHRDLKPENVFLTRDGAVKILDFGLAKATSSLEVVDGETMPPAAATADGVVLGTVGYMSPEQVRGEPADHRSDIFALGAVLYESLTGRRAFHRGSAVETMSAILTAEPVPLASDDALVFPALDRIIRRCLEKSPGDRYQSAKDVEFTLEELSRSVGSSSTGSGRVTAVLSAPRRTARRWIAGAAVGAAALVLLAMNAGGLRDRWSNGPAAGRIDSVAVLPLANLSGRPEEEFFADGMTDALITGLSKLGGFRRVISRTSVMTYKGSRAALPEIGRALGVDAIVEGSVIRSGDKVRIVVQLRRSSTEQPLWTETFDRDLRDILSLQSELTSTIAQRISLAVSPQDRKRLALAGAVNPEAHLAYLKGRYHLGRAGRQEIDAAIADFKDAIARDPRSAIAYAGLSDAYTALRSAYLPPNEVMPQANTAARKAVELDDRSAEAHIALGNVHLYYDWNWDAAAREFRRATDLNPGLAVPHSSLAITLAVSGNDAASVVESRRALELDPLSLPALNDVAWAYYLGRHYPDAIEIAKRAVELAPDQFLAYTTLGLAYEKTGRLDDAIALLEEARRHDDSPTMLEMLGGAYAAAGRDKDAEGVLADLTKQAGEHYVCPYEVATVYVGLKKNREAIEWLEKGYRDHADCMPWIATDSKLDPLRDNQQFRDIQSRIGVRR